MKRVLTLLAACLLGALAISPVGAGVAPVPIEPKANGAPGEPAVPLDEPDGHRQSRRDRGVRSVVEGSAGHGASVQTAEAGTEPDGDGSGAGDGDGHGDLATAAAGIAVAVLAGAWLSGRLRSRGTRTT